MKKGEKVETAIEVVRLEEAYIDVCVIGTTPLLFNSMSAKAQRELLLPSGKKSAADKASKLKHDPVEEFRASIYASRDPQSPTLLEMPSPAFKSALADVALDMPGDGVNKSKIARLTWVEGYRVPVWGVPLLCMAGVRMANMERTPDIRTRAVVLEWASRFRIHFASTMVKEQAVVNLLAAAGRLRGVGDFRPQKGKGSFGQFEIVGPKDPRFVALLKMGRKAQEQAMANPVPWDGLADTTELLTWFAAESTKRGWKNVAA